MSKRKQSEDDYLCGMKVLINNAETKEEREMLISQLGRKTSQSCASKKSKLATKDLDSKLPKPKKKGQSHSDNVVHTKAQTKDSGKSKALAKTKKAETEKEVNVTITFAAKPTNSVEDRSKIKQVCAPKAEIKSEIKQESSNISKEEKPAVKKCSLDCKPGARSDCTIRSGLKLEGALSCRDVHDMLKKMGVKNITNTSRCIRAAIMRKFISVTGDKSDLDKVVFRSKAKCGHMFGATLRQLLYQPDHPKEVDKRQDELKCQYATCTAGDMNIYVAGFCMNDPTATDGKRLHHCVGCPAFGRCLFDSRVSHFDVSGKHKNL